MLELLCICRKSQDGKKEAIGTFSSRRYKKKKKRLSACDQVDDFGLGGGGDGDDDDDVDVVVVHLGKMRRRRSLDATPTIVWG